MKNNWRIMRNVMAACMICVGLSGVVSPAYAMDRDADKACNDHSCITLQSSYNSSTYSDLIFPYSSNVFIEESDLYGLTRDQLQECINDIYARHGYIFKDAEIRKHYESQNWYRGYISDPEAVVAAFNNVERANIQMLVNYKARLSSPTGNISNSCNEPRILPDTCTTLIYKSDLYGLSRNQIQMLINDIYARHGYIFQDSEIRAYYERQSWYRGYYSDMETVAQTFNRIEQENIATMKSMMN